VRDGRLGRDRDIVVEAWYPAKPGSEIGKPRLGYDIRQHVPPKQQEELADAANVTYQACECFRELPVADGGPFPVVIYVHGTGAFRTESLHSQTHWASRGFVVFAADHPGIQLRDMLGVLDGIVPPEVKQKDDARGILKSLSGLPHSAPSFASLAGRLDTSKVGAVGHSAGGFAVDELSDDADVLIPMAGLAPTVTPARARSTLALAARNDSIVGYARELASFAKLRGLPGTDLRRFASVDGLGHLFCSDLCWIGASAGGLVEIAEAHGIRAASLFRSLGQDGCAFLNKQAGPRYLEPACGWQFVNFASAAALEETLRCDNRMAAQLSRIKTVMPIPAGCPRDMVFDYEESEPQFFV
jgi:dienelactone hydrolase